MKLASILLGGNLGNRVENLTLAIQLIKENCGKIIHTSAMYETAAWGIANQPDFLNQAITIETSLSPEKLLQQLLSIENKMGRKRSVKYGARTIDLDILLFDDAIINLPNLQIPHPALTQRRFALIPLTEIAGSTIHPIEKKTIQQLLLDCKDELNVKKYSAITY